MAEFNSSLNKETSELLQLIECPVCLEVSYPPIYQCHRGHIVCWKCIPRIKECPICRQRMPDIRIRNRVVEKLTENIVAKPCPNSNFGCKIRLKHEDIEDHLRLCDYCSRDYCNRIGLGNLLGCSKTITKREISSHLRNDHLLNHLVVKSFEVQVLQDISNVWKTESRTFFPVTLSVFNEYFFLVSELTKQSNCLPKISWKCVAAAPIAKTAEFFAKITLTNPDKKLKLNWQGPVLSIDDMNDNANYLSIPFETLKQFNTTKYENTEKLEWTIKMVIKESSAIKMSSVVNSLASLNTTPQNDPAQTRRNYLLSDRRECDADESPDTPPDCRQS